MCRVISRLRADFCSAPTPAAANSRSASPATSFPSGRPRFALSACAMKQARLIDAVRERFGAKAAVTDPIEIEPWLTDWRGRYHGKSGAVLAPASTAEVAAIVALAGEFAVPLVPQGGNTSMVGGATPPAGGSALVLSLRRM